MQLIDGTNYRYISEIPELKNHLPHGILAKKATDVGGTFAALSSPSSYIIVVPFVDLLLSIEADKHNANKVQSIYSKTNYLTFKHYVANNILHKFVVTYDSFPKLINWLESTNQPINNYRVLIDEYHLLLEDLGFREDAITKLMQTLSKFSHYTFMSATPIAEDFLPKQLAELPYTEINWGKKQIIKPHRIKTANVYSALSKIIQTFQNNELNLESSQGLKKVEQLFIFLNSVSGIKQVISTCKLTNDDVKVICADTLRNNQILDNIKIGSILKPNAPINFFTKKGFQGCNLFSNNALTIVVSDGKKACTLIDVETTLYQIVGRLRTNNEYNNIFKDKIWHIYSSRKSVQSKEDFNTYMNSLQKETNIVISTYPKLTKEEREVYVRRMDIEDLICYYNEDSDLYEYSELKEKYLRYNYKLVNHIYENGLTLRTAYEQANLNGVDNTINIDDIVLSKAKTVSHSELLKQYIELRKLNTDPTLIKRYEIEHPHFKQAYDILGEKEIAGAFYLEGRIKERLYFKSPNVLNLIATKVYNQTNGQFITNKEAKQLVALALDELKITQYKPTTALLNLSDLYKVETSQKTIDKKRVTGITLTKIL